MKVIKRDGRIVEFDPRLIEYAILKAFNAVDKEMSDYAVMKARNIAEYIQDHYTREKTTPSVEDIQDLVEKGLMSTKRKDVAKEYITYRNKRNEVRNRNTQLRKKIKEKLAAVNVQNQNANVDEKSFGGRMGEAGSEMFRDIGLNDGYMSDMAKNNHLNNMIYYHDLDHLVVGDHNCLSIPFDKLLANGFNTRQTDVRPAGSVSTAFQLVAVIFQLQSLQQFGGVSATHLDWTMVPYVRKSFYKHYLIGLEYFGDDAREPLRCFLRKNITPVEVSIDDEIYKTAGMESPYPCVKKIYKYAMDMTVRETYQAAESMYHNLK